MGILDQLSRASADLAVASLDAAGKMFGAAGLLVDTMIGVAAPPSTKPPVNGPPDLDNAISDFANRAARIAYFTRGEKDALPDVVNGLAHAARAAFRGFDWSDPRNLALPLRLPFSVGTLLTDVGMRAVEGMDAIGRHRYLEFIWYAFQIFAEFPVYLTLEYRQLTERQEKWVADHPQDAAARTELGRTLLKMGRFDEAVFHLRIAAESNPDVRSTALHEAGVALYFSGEYLEAARTGSAALDADPNNAPARYWIWMAAQKLGGYPPDVPESNRMDMTAGWAAASVEYEDIASAAGLDKTSGGRGIAVFDYDGDGSLDVAIACAHGGLSLYRNNGDGTFKDVSVESGVYRAVNGFGLAAGDYTNSGFPSLCVVRNGFYGGMVELWRNNGDGTFSDVSVESGVSAWATSFTCSWVDYDCDGKLDLFICTNLGGLFDRKVPHKLFRNNGDGTFTDVAQEAGIHSPWGAIGHSWGDYNNDGHPDLFLSNTIGRPQLFRNNGDGTFTDVTKEAKLDVPALAFNAQFVDIDNDGWLDIVQYTWSIHEDTIYSMRTGHAPPHGHATRVYRNNRDGTFSIVSPDLGLTECWGSMSGNAADINNDGHLDIVLGNGGPLMDRSEPMVVLENDGGRFRDVTFSAGLPIMGKGHGINCADLFGDGRLSILCATGGAYPGDLMTTSVFAPKRRPGNYLAVVLQGTKSNRGAVGARLKLVAGGREQHRVLNGGSNFGCLPPQQHFGLGTLEQAESLEVWWPSGLTETFANLPVNARIKIIEGSGEFTLY
jgi:tetratricopeptide (TPR) repeat protein